LGLFQKPEAFTTFGQSDFINNNYLGIKDLTPTIDGQYLLAERGQRQWLFHYPVIIIMLIKKITNELSDFLNPVVVFLLISKYNHLAL